MAAIFLPLGVSVLDISGILVGKVGRDTKLPKKLLSKVHPHNLKKTYALKGYQI